VRTCYNESLKDEHGEIKFPEVGVIKSGNISSKFRHEDIKYPLMGEIM
jgi:hypothetical protein